MDMTVTAWEAELTTTYGNDEDFFEHYTEFAILAVLIVIVTLVGLAGNAVVLWLLGFRMRRNAFSVYVLNLAGADFLFFFCLMIYFLYSIFNLDFLNEVIDSFLWIVATFAYISGLSFLSAISTERCMSVLWPIWYRCHRPTHMSAIMCSLLWALSLLLSILDGSCSGILNWTVHQVWCQVLDFITVVWMILLFLFLTGSSLTLMNRLLCSSKRVPPTRLYMTVIITVLVFLLCGLPFGIQASVIVWFQIEYDVLSKLSMTFLLLSCVNSCANPFIYFFVGSFRQRWRRQRHTLRLVLQRALQDTPEVEEPRESLPREVLEMSGSSLGQ